MSLKKVKKGKALFVLSSHEQLLTVNKRKGKLCFLLAALFPLVSKHETQRSH